MGDRRITGRVVSVRFAAIGQRASWRGEIAAADANLWTGPPHASLEDAEAELILAARRSGGVELDPPLTVAEVRAGDLCLGPLGNEVYALEDGPSPDKLRLKVPATEQQQAEVRQRLREEQAKALQAIADVAAATGDPDVITSAAEPTPDRKPARVVALVSDVDDPLQAGRIIPEFVAAGAKGVLVVGFFEELDEPLDVRLFGAHPRASHWALLAAHFLRVAQLAAGAGED